MTCVAIIPARGGSHRIKKKNIRKFHGRPILAYAIETAKASGLFERIVVSTDDFGIAQVAVSNGAEIHIRSEEFAKDEVGTQAVAKHVLEDLAIDDGAVCVIYATTPLLSPENLHDGRACLTEENVYAMSVQASPLADAGAFYWGWAQAFRAGIPLIGPLTAMVPLPAERVCDINTPEDWLRAEEMYMALQEGK